MIQYLEAGDRLLRCELLPDDVPTECRRRTLTVSVLSGAELTVDEWQRISAGLIAELVGEGIDVRSWGVDTEESDS